LPPGLALAIEPIAESANFVALPVPRGGKEPKNAARRENSRAIRHGQGAADPQTAPTVPTR
jgi:hypothetical protein